MTRGFYVVILMILAVSCRVSSPVFTPDPKDPAYHCHAADGSVIADDVWCFPVDGRHECCPVWHACQTLEGEPICAYTGSDAVNDNSHGDYYSARKPMKRQPENPGAAP
jgi:hypothetical protein